MKSCALCSRPLQPVQLLAARVVMEFGYTDAESKPSLWDGRYPVEGRVRPHVCPDCGQVFFFAEIARDSLPLPSAPPSEDTASLPIPAERASEE